MIGVRTSVRDLMDTQTKVYTPASLPDIGFEDGEIRQDLQEKQDKTK